MESTVVASNSIVLEVLNQHNYKDWTSRVETYLLAKDLWDVVNAEPPKPEDKAWTRKNAKALHAIKISCGTQLFSFIRETRTAKIAWEVLERQFKSLDTLHLEKKEREEREKSLHTSINVAGQTRDEGKELIQANKALEIKASEGEREERKRTHTKIDDAREKVISATEDWDVKSVEGGNNENNSNYDLDSSYEPLFDFVVNGDLINAKECLATLPPNALRARNQAHSGCTALHIAARGGHLHIIKELVLLMTREDLEIKENHGYTALHVAALYGNVDIVKELVPVMRQQGLGIRTTTDGNTALHIAVAKDNVHIVKELVSLMREEDLEMQNAYGYSVLHLAAQNCDVHIVKELVPFMRTEALEIKDGTGYTALARALEVCHWRGHKYSEGDVIEMTKCMIEKNQRLLTTGVAPKNFIPVVEACRWLKLQLTRYLYSVTPPVALRPPENGSQGASFFWFCFKAEELDIAWDLLSNCPSLATVENVDGVNSPILVLSRMHYAFLSGMRLKFWQKWIYDCINIQPQATFNIHHLSINVTNSEDNQDIRRDLIISAVSLFRRLVKSLLELLGINCIYEMKLTHVRMFEFIRFMGEATRDMNVLTLAQLNMVKKSIFEAIERGDVEFVTRVCKANPQLVEILDEKQRSIFHFAVECRQEKIYSLIYGIEKEKRNQFGIYAMNFNNSMLHGAANLSPLSQFNNIQGASLQMQRELQWFQEVQSVVPRAIHETRNSSDDLTAHELFHKNHQKLMEDAEISMKGTATSCTVVAALIVTIMFTVAFTIPGGNNSNTGLPMFIYENLFLVFIVSDITSLVSSTTSVIIFLGILTSRYAENDFLKNLPTKMIIGLFTIFISIATMMTAFCCGLVIMLQGRYSWVAIPSILVACIPIFSFVWMLFPLLVHTFISTYGPGIFNRKVKPWY